MLEQGLKAILPSTADCRAKAASLRAAYPGMGDEALAAIAVQKSRVLMTVAGASAGFITLPVAALPVGAAELWLTLEHEARLVGTVAALLEPEVLNDADAFSSDILAVLFPGAVSAALGQLAISAGKRTTRTVLRKHVSWEVMRAIIRFAARYLGVKLTRKTLVARVVPVVGAAIGAAWNWIEVERVGQRAIRYYREAQQETSAV